MKLPVQELDSDKLGKLIIQYSSDSRNYLGNRQESNYKASATQYLRPLFDFSNLGGANTFDRQETTFTLTQGIENNNNNIKNLKILVKDFRATYLIAFCQRIGLQSGRRYL